MSTALDAIFADLTSDLEVIVELNSAKRSDGTLQTWYASTHLRSDTPAGTTAFFLPFLPLGGSLGPLGQSLSEDVLFSGLAQNNPGTLTLLQTDVTPDLLSVMNDYVFAGYRVRIKVGRVTDAYSAFEIYRSPTVDIDPSVVLTNEGIQATFQLAGAFDRMLAESLIVKRYVGIPYCLRSSTTTGATTVTRVAAAHDLTRFTIKLRFRTVTVASGGNCILFRKLVSAATDSNWRLLLLAGSVLFDNTAGGATDISIASPATYADGEWHNLKASYDYTGGAGGAYLKIDDVLIGIDTPSGTAPNLSVANPAFLKHNISGDSIEMCDIQLYNKFTHQDEEPSSLSLVGLWRCDDNAGGAVNDYSTTAADGAIGGVLNTDYSWQPSDLGGPALAGKPYPINVGNVLNARAHLIGSKRYRGNADAVGWHASGSNTTLTVKSQGTVLTGGGVDYTAPSDGGDGVFSTVSSEGEPVTYDLVNNGTFEQLTYPAYVAYSLLTERTRIESASIANLSPLLILCPWPSGYYTDADANAATALQEILGESGMCYFEDAEGGIYMDMVLPPINYGPYGEPALDIGGVESGGVTFGDVGDCAGSMTVAAWFYTHLTDQTGFALGGTEPNAGTIYIGAKPNTAGNYALYFQSSGPGAGKLKFVIAGTTLSSPAGLIENGEWYFVAATLNTTTDLQKIYVGKLGGTLAEVASGSNTGTPTTGVGNLAVGSDGSGGTQTPWATVQHLQVWSPEAKSLAQLQALMDDPPVGNETNLVAYCPMNEGTGAPIEVVTAATGTVMGAEWAPKLLIDLDSTPSVTLSGFHHLDPAYNIIVNYAKNHHPMSDADIDTGITDPTERLTLTREGLSEPFFSPDTQTRFKGAKKIVLDSPIIDQESAQKLLQVIRRRFGTDVYIGTLEFPPGLNISRLACGLQLGDEIGLTASIPSQLQTPRSFRVVAVAPDPIQLSTTIVFMG